MVCRAGAICYGMLAGGMLDRYSGWFRNVSIFEGADLVATPRRPGRGG